MNEPIWHPFLTDRDVEVFAASGYGSSQSLGERPVLMVIDITADFVGDRPEPILDSIKRFPNSGGEEGWEAMHRLVPLLAAARAAGVPVIYTANDPAHHRLEQASWGRKNSRMDERRSAHGGSIADIPELIRPADADLVLLKTKPSGFFDTPLRQYLTMWGADTVLCCGTSTSGCVRATVVDAFSHGYQVGVVADCTFDRGQASHALSLFDMAQKYADLLDSTDLVEGWANG
jgi:maleamate amidohydrolase